MYLLHYKKIELYIGNKQKIIIYCAAGMLIIMISIQLFNIFTPKSRYNIYKIIPFVFFAAMAVISVNSIEQYDGNMLIEDMINNNEEITDSEFKGIQNKTVINDNNADLIKYVYRNLVSFDGTQVKMEGFVCLDDNLTNNDFILRKNIMHCCKADEHILAIYVCNESSIMVKENQKIIIQGIIKTKRININGSFYLIPQIVSDNIIIVI